LTLSIDDIQHKSTFSYGECCYTECHDYLNVTLSVILLNVVMLSVVAPKGTSYRHFICWGSLTTKQSL